MTKIMTWVKENKTTSILIGAGAAFLIYQAIKPSPKTALSGIRKSKGKRKKGKAKNHPPHTVSGTRKRRIKKIKL